MYIEREGKKIELTREELANACWEYDRICHRSDIDAVIDPANYGITREELDGLIDDIVDEYESFIEDDEHWADLIVHAARIVIDEYKEGKEDA